METTAYNSEFNDEESGASNKTNNDVINSHFPLYNEAMLRIANVKPPKDNIYLAPFLQFAYQMRHLLVYTNIFM